MSASKLEFLSPLGERLGEGVIEDYLLHHPLTQPLPQGGEEHEEGEANETRKVMLRPLSRSV
jgi:hypothetical protein